MKLAPPLDSLDPLDWMMYCDLLQDAGVSRRRWSFAQRVARSLQASPKLVLVLACTPASLENHWLRVGRSWFVPVEGTSIEGYASGYAWWQPRWVRRGLRHYPYNQAAYGVRDESQLIELASGTPWEHPHPAFEQFRLRWGLEALKKTFFRGHGLHRLPAAWG
jgi:hypothetical protein